MLSCFQMIGFSNHLVYHPQLPVNLQPITLERTQVMRPTAVIDPKDPGMRAFIELLEEAYEDFVHTKDINGSVNMRNYASWRAFVPLYLRRLQLDQQDYSTSKRTALFGDVQLHSKWADLVYYVYKKHQ